MDITIQKLPQEFSICKLPNGATIPNGSPFLFFSKTDEENSLVCETSAVPAQTLCRDDHWRGFRIVGILDFSLIGILAGISNVLASQGIGIFAISTFNTDYILVKSKSFTSATESLSKAGYRII